jgi:broad specificity phosphatase PhoE
MVSPMERAKDTAQVLTESAATHIGRIALIVTKAIGEVAHETGEWLTDVFEMRDAATRAREDEPAQHNFQPGDPAPDRTRD